MSTTTHRLIPYQEERALEDVAYGHQLVPTRMFAVLFPVWSVEVQSTVTHGEPYELIDRYLELGLAEGCLETADDLARFFGLDRVLVERALRFLTAIGHLTSKDGRHSLTELGHRSVRDKKRYVVTREDRRKLFFDALASRPLTRPYYESRTVTLLSRTDAQEVASRRNGPEFTLLMSQSSFDPSAVEALADDPQRDRYNLPERIDDPRILDQPELCYLPMYLVRALTPEGSPHLLAYTQVGDAADSDMGRLCRETPDLVTVLETEERIAQAAVDGSRIREWLRRKDLGSGRVVQQRNGVWRATVPGAAFGSRDSEGALSLSKLGSFIMQGRSFFQVWCADEHTRRRALLERIESTLRSRPRIERAEVEERLGKIVRQLELGEIDLPTLRKLAERAGRRGLARQLARLT